MRVHELAKELDVNARDLLARLAELRIDARNQLSQLTEADVDLARRSIAQRPVVPAPPKPKPEPPPPPPPPPPPAPEPQQEAVVAATETKPPETPREAAPAQPAAETPAAEAKPAKPATVEPAPAKPATATLKPEPPKSQKPAAQPAAAPRIPPRPVKPSKKAAPVVEPEKPAPSNLTVAGTVIKAKGPIIVRDLAECLGMRPNKVIAELMKVNILASINERLDVPQARRLAEAHGFTLDYEKRIHDRPPVLTRKPEGLDDDEDRPEDLVTRAPVVTFLGHVDHGKTSLMDKIRNAQVAKGEHGGITQHIGAYTAESGGRGITFLDTPGHAAFTAMRARGANLTDIAVIIIDAVDGVMPQTREAIQHAKAAEVSVMVAINKIDLPGANPERVLQQLQSESLAPEEWGGDTICCRVSALTGEGIPHLLEMILLQADVLDLKANPKRHARGFVVESRLLPGMGPTANLLVTNGTLKVGDAVLCGRYWGRVRALINDHGNKVKSAGPSSPVMCLGLSGVPEAGAEFRVAPTDRIARDMAEAEHSKLPKEQAIAPRKLSLDSLFTQMKESEKTELRVILKADTQGSVEAISHALSDIKSDKVSLSVLLAGTGNITVNDVMLASASNAVVLGFHVAREPGVDSTAKREGVEIQTHQIIYELLDQVRDAMTGLLAPATRINVTGHAEIKQIFIIGKTGKIAGCLVTDGKGTAKSKVRVLRGKETLYEGSIDNLRHFQDSVAEIREAQECGIRLNRYSDFQVGDVIEFYEMETIKQTL